MAQKRINDPQKAIDALKERVNKYGKFSKQKLEEYYFKKRLASFIPAYIAELKKVTRVVEKANNSYNLQRKINRIGK